MVVKRGTTEILGYGIVESDYYRDEERNILKNVRKIKWHKKGVWAWEPESKLPVKTLTNVTQYPDFIQTLKQLIGVEP